MNKFVKLNDFVQVDEIIYRVVAVDNRAYLTIDCKNKNMPVWKSDAELHDETILTELEAFEFSIIMWIIMMNSKIYVKNYSNDNILKIMQN